MSKNTVTKALSRSLMEEYDRLAAELDACNEEWRAVRARAAAEEARMEKKWSELQARYRSTGEMMDRAIELEMSGQTARR